VSEAAPPGGPGETFWASLRELAQDLQGLVSDRLELLALELQRAGQALGQIVMLIVAAAILGLTAWLALWLSVAGALMALGLDWPWAGVAVLLVNLLACVLALSRVRTLLPKLGLPATRRHLTIHAQAGASPRHTSPSSPSSPPTLMLPVDEKTKPAA